MAWSDHLAIITHLFASGFSMTSTLKNLLALVAALDFGYEQGDIILKLPDGRIARLNKTLCGLCRSPRLWY
jgi:hypothetical protein